MHFEPDEVYHLYNRGNNKQPIFFNNKNYLFLLKKIRKEWKEYCEILCYCLMPNHFHVMIIPNKEGCMELMNGDKLSNLQNLSKAIGKTLSSYTKAINTQNNNTGNLFQKKTKAKLIDDNIGFVNNLKKSDYLVSCFFYIHQNPLKANLVADLKEWPFSSWLDYAFNRNDTLCNKKLLWDLTGLSEADCLHQNPDMDDNVIKQLF
jgi:putative transposase